MYRLSPAPSIAKDRYIMLGYPASVNLTCIEHMSVEGVPASKIVLDVVQRCSLATLACTFIDKDDTGDTGALVQGILMSIHPAS
jgi:hypothetical protein